MSVAVIVEVSVAFIVASDTPSLTPSEVGRYLQSLRKNKPWGTSGRPRTVRHDPNARSCYCADCRRKRYPDKYRHAAGSEPLPPLPKKRSHKARTKKTRRAKI
jgi:hypothetical protein